ncbi:hypothetical protein [Chryseobacterium sp.]|uniref:hypothetical protein n=1 Tax=Chryseobacterium sp. TaxID=1871047 RepID=UPI000EE7FA4A|nr:hypothetical protein [Chryseobacterium sp.]HCA06941.1 hypothetical protein [Chryseobacterium sp.]
MDKYKIILLCKALLVAQFSYAQIGINTSNPQAAFHIDGRKDNLALDPPTADQQANDVVTTATGSMGIGIVKVDSSSKLEIKSNQKGFLPPRLTLINVSDATTIPHPATGLTVYHKGSSNLEAGLYYNLGTSISPSWSKGGQTIINENQGKFVYKSPLQPLTNNPIINVGEFEFRVLNTDKKIYIRYTGTSTSKTYLVFTNEYWTGSGYSVADDMGVASSTFSLMAGTTTLSNNELNIVRIYDNVSKKVYRYEVNLIVKGGQTYISQIVETY